MREINSKSEDKSRGCPPKRMRSAPQQSPQSKLDDETEDYWDYLVRGLPPGTKFDIEGVRLVMHKIHHPSEVSYLDLPSWAIGDDEYGDDDYGADDRDDFHRWLDEVVADLEDDDEEPHQS